MAVHEISLVEGAADGFFKVLGTCPAFKEALRMGHNQARSPSLEPLTSQEGQESRTIVVGLTPPTILFMSSGETTVDSLHKLGQDCALSIMRFYSNK